MDEALELHNYLPLSFKTRSEQEYIAFLWDAFETNYTRQKYQFAYHMLTMSFVYFNIWQIKQTEPGDFEKGLIGFLLQSHDPEEREYDADADQIREMLIHENYLSRKDIDICLGFDLASLAQQPEIDSIRRLHEMLQSAYGAS